MTSSNKKEAKRNVKVILSKKNAYIIEECAAEEDNPVKYSPVSEYDLGFAEVFMYIKILRLEILSEIGENGEYTEYMTGIANFTEVRGYFDSLSLFGDALRGEYLDDIRILIYRNNEVQSLEGFYFIVNNLKFYYTLEIDYRMSRDTFDKIKSELKNGKIESIFSNLNVKNVNGLYHLADGYGPRHFKILNDKIVLANPEKLPHSFKTTEGNQRLLHSFWIRIIHKEVTIENDTLKSSEVNDASTKDNSKKYCNECDLEVLKNPEQPAAGSEHLSTLVSKIYDKFLYLRIAGSVYLLFILASVFFGK